MNVRLPRAALFFATALTFLLLARHARGEGPVPNMIPSGKYVAHVMPEFNRATAHRIETRLKGIKGIDTVVAHAEDSSVHLTIKDRAQVDTTDLTHAVETVVPGAVMTTPVLEHSLSPNPGL